MEKKEFSVFSYNLLSTDLAREDWHNKCKPHCLKTEFRWALIQKILYKQVLLESIICLQELSFKWIELLLVFFSSNNYTFIYDSQILGVGIAFPKNTFKLENIHFINIGELIKKECILKPSVEKSLFEKALQMLYYIPSWEKKEEDIWQLAIKRRNSILGIKLSMKQDCFYVFNVHMPCAFKTLDLMNIHATAVFKAIEPYKVKYPLVLAGDFNSKKDSDVLKIFTTTTNINLPQNNGKYEKVLNNDFLLSAAPMRSACEPLFTNFSHTKNSTEVFCDTIDYIFYNLSLECTSTLKTLTSVPTNDSFPNEDEPSDHIPISARFRFH